MSAHQSATPIVSPDHLLQIGQVIVVWSKLENAMQDTIWHFLHLEMTDGKIVTERMGPETFLRILRAIGSRNLNEPVLHEFLSTMDKIEDRLEDRNIIAHATWGTLLPDNVPLGTSLRPKAAPGEVMAETFPHERMLSIVREILEALDFLDKLMTQLKTSPRESDEEPT